MALTFDPPADPGFLGEDVIAEICADPGFGVYFSDHMVVANWTPDKGWSDDRIIDYGPTTLEPSASVYHYAQEIFEGLKAYRREDGSVWLFRPEVNAARFRRSAVRIALPELDEADFLTSVRNLVTLEERWVPSGVEQSLYLRPFMIGTEHWLGVRPAQEATYCVIASPVGAYFKSGVHAVEIWVSKDYARVATGGTGAAKCGGNYAASLLPQRLAQQQGCSQVLFLDAAEHRFVEELGGMNFFIITSDNQLITPELNGNILPGVTRDSLLTVAPQLGLTPVERPLDITEVYRGIQDGSIVEAFACGTAAVITPIRSLRDAEGVHTLPETANGKAHQLRNFLVDIQYGRRADSYGWTEQVC